MKTATTFTYRTMLLVLLAAMVFELRLGKSQVPSSPQIDKPTDGAAPGSNPFAPSTPAPGSAPPKIESKQGAPLPPAVNSLGIPEELVVPDPPSAPKSAEPKEASAAPSTAGEYGVPRIEDQPVLTEQQCLAEGLRDSLRLQVMAAKQTLSVLETLLGVSEPSAASTSLLDELPTDAAPSILIVPSTAIAPPADVAPHVVQSPLSLASTGAFAATVRPMVQPVVGADQLRNGAFEPAEAKIYQSGPTPFDSPNNGPKNVADQYTSLRFVEPCTFPLATFRRSGEPAEAEIGLMILEGMELLFADDGRYEIRLTVNPPTMPTTLNLALHLSSWDAETRGFIPERLLTVPPIEIAPIVSDGKTVTTPQIVRAVGYSPLIAYRLEELNKVAQCQRRSANSTDPILTRSGTIRCGSGVVR